ncbi:hypothetical protein NQ176_g10810 [Zarea fungicola]|uniref:Uncharacterized protein n=1 Tax=Zarea fungicola TaxID=93591 RepID=A0ACC1MEC3_9HYPO|nr:hypothetical protein NQ176_g10810 [Lecanicillium fungicola]
MAAPPLQQQPPSSMDPEEENPPASEEAGTHESFPPLPLTPIHENSMADEFEAVIRPYEVPGADRYPRGRYFRPGMRGKGGGGGQGGGRRTL